MKKELAKKGCIAAGVLFMASLYSQEENNFLKETSIDISGSVDGYFRANLNTYNRYLQEDESDPIAPPTSFANKPGFALGMANIKLESTYKNVGAVVDLVAGPRGEEAVSVKEGSTELINQLYVYWNPTEKMTLTLGRFNTFLGYEVISPVDNFNYSTSYMFSYGPFSHTGLKVDYQFSDTFSGMVSVMNPTDVTSYNPVGSYYLGGQLGYSNKGKNIYLNVLWGDQDGDIEESDTRIGTVSKGHTFQMDLTAMFDVSEKVFLGVNTTYNQTETGELSEDLDRAGFWGAALYTQYKFSKKASLGLRTEYFNEFDGGVGALGLYDTEGDADVWDVTLTGNIAWGPLQLKPEIRYDFASESIFADEKNGNLQSTLGSFLVAAIYQF